MKNQCFRLPKCFRKLRAAPGCLWLLLAAPGCSCRAGSLKIKKMRHRPARPGQHSRAPAAKCSRPGREHFVARVRKCCGPGCYGANVCAFTLFTHKYSVCTIKHAKLSEHFPPEGDQTHKYNVSTFKNTKLSQLFPPGG